VLDPHLRAGADVARKVAKVGANKAIQMTDNLRMKIYRILPDPAGGWILVRQASDNEYDFIILGNYETETGARTAKAKLEKSDAEEAAATLHVFPPRHRNYMGSR
jgi:hypothetical protein